MNRIELHHWAVEQVADAWQAVGAKAEPTDGEADLLITLPNCRELRVQVWAARRGGDGSFTYGFRRKDRLRLERDQYVVRVHVEAGTAALYLIPTLAWESPDGLLVSRDFVGRNSPPEWGINTPNGRLPKLEQRFGWDTQMRRLGLHRMPSVTEGPPRR